MKIVEELRNERLRQGLSQNALAKLAGTNQSTLSLIEQGHIQPTIKMLTNIADALRKKIVLE